MSHLVIDVLIAHELDLTIPASEIVERLPEWNRAHTARSRADYVKGVAKFCGLELLDYDNAQIHKNLNGDVTVKIRGVHWTQRQPV